jgi:hypothetical protein
MKLCTFIDHREVIYKSFYLLAVSVTRRRHLYGVLVRKEQVPVQRKGVHTKVCSVLELSGTEWNRPILRRHSRVQF